MQKDTTTTANAEMIHKPPKQNQKSSSSIGNSVSIAVAADNILISAVNTPTRLKGKGHCWDKIIHITTLTYSQIMTNNRHAISYTCSIFRASWEGFATTSGLSMCCASAKNGSGTTASDATPMSLAPRRHGGAASRNA